jgi:hypothetical protein
MSPNDLLKFTRKSPFVPFRLQVSDGTSYEIRHPEFCMVLQTSVVIGVPANASTGIPESAEWVDARHIVKAIPLIQPINADEEAGPSSNGTPE